MKLTVDGNYQFTAKEHVLYLTVWCLVCSGMGWIFYDTPEMGIFGIMSYWICYKGVYKYKMWQHQRQIRLEFKDTMMSIYSSLSAGATLEESMKRVLVDMERSLKNGARMVDELRLICQKMERNVPVGQCLEEMALRCDNKDMQNFSQIISIGKRQGGNMVQLVRDSVEKIQRRIEISHEIEGTIGAKRGEFVFMSCIPVGIIMYMRVFSPEFMSVLYDNIIGRICMTVCMIIYIAAILLGMHILRLD